MVIFGIIIFIVFSLATMVALIGGCKKMALYCVAIGLTPYILGISGMTSSDVIGAFIGFASIIAFLVVLLGVSVMVSLARDKKYGKLPVDHSSADDKAMDLAAERDAIAAAQLMESSNAYMQGQGPRHVTHTKI